MITSVSFGFISYNSHDFLQHVLQSFIDDGVFTRCACWYHESTGKDKNHFHCWVEPAKQIDTATIQDKFIELNADDTQQSIAIRPKCKSKWVDAYLYGIHNGDYLVYKGMERELVNIVSDKHIYIGDFTADFVEAESYLFKFCLAPYLRLKRLVYAGKTLEDIYIQLRTPFAQLNAVSTAYRVIRTKMLKDQQERKMIEDNELTVIHDDLFSPFNED